MADGATDLVGLAVADGDGVWLRVERVSMAWVPSRLLKGELAITKLAADKVQVLRAPKPGPDGAPPAFGPMRFQKKEWFQWPPPLFLTAPRIPSGTAARLEINSSTDLDASSGALSSALLRLVT